MHVCIYIYIYIYVYVKTPRAWRQTHGRLEDIAPEKTRYRLPGRDQKAWNTRTPCPKEDYVKTARMWRRSVEHWEAPPPRKLSKDCSFSSSSWGQLKWSWTPLRKYIYIYICIERERESKRDICMCIYIYIHTTIYIGNWLCHCGKLGPQVTHHLAKTPGHH